MTSTSQLSRITSSYKTIQGQPVKVDIYPPKLGKIAYADVVTVPAVIYFHGGGLTVGNRRSWFPEWFARRMTDAGIAFVCPDYSLLPPATGHDIVTDIKDLFSYLAQDSTVVQVTTEDQVLVHCQVDGNAIAVAGCSAGSLCAYLAASLKPKPRAIVSLYGMGGDFMIPHWLEPKQMPYIPGRELLDPEDFNEYLYPFHLPKTTDSPLQYYGHDYPIPGYPANPRMLLSRLYIQLGVYLDYYLGEHTPSISKILRDKQREALLSEPSENWAKPLIPARHLTLFPQFNITADWPPVFLMHGSHDFHVPVQESQNLYDVLKRKDVLVELHILTDKEHSFDLGRDAEAEFGSLFDRVGMFLRENLQGGR